MSVVFPARGLFGNRTTAKHSHRGELFTFRHNLKPTDHLQSNHSRFTAIPLRQSSCNRRAWHFGESARFSSSKLYQRSTFGSPRTLLCRQTGTTGKLHNPSMEPIGTRHSPPGSGDYPSSPSPEPRRCASKLSSTKTRVRSPPSSVPRGKP